MTRRPMARAGNPDLAEQADTLVALLRDRGPLATAELRRAADARYWGPGCFGAALAHARHQGRVRRVGLRAYAAVE